MKKPQPSKAQILGTISISQVTGDYLPDLEAMNRPFADEKSVVRVFCRGCGYCVEITQQAANLLLNFAGQEAPSSWGGIYFESERCPICSDNYQKVSLKKM